MHPFLSFAAGLSLGAVVAVRAARARRTGERVGAAALEALLNAIEANDPATGAHVRRVATYADIIAESIGLAPDERRAVVRVALFHDIGKIHEALFDIVRDDDELTLEARRAIASHPVRGARVLEPLRAFYPDLAGGVLAHHERWDGRGYPQRLRGRRIPLASRIVALADTFDVVTHGRQYRPGRSTSAAVRVIAEGRALQFDPELVDIMLLPPVLDALRGASHGPAVAPRPRRRRAERRHGELRPAPDVSFRWHPEARGRRVPAPGR
ncbi:MAG TPA: HD domain-containing phosphohydrolase [Gemmatimonadaceae bacterium]|nr:HD domain-containing phosphohydrolase [Gemmatimonadaceae bacterium]